MSEAYRPGSAAPDESETLPQPPRGASPLVRQAGCAGYLENDSNAEEQKLRVLKATMRTVHHIVNNFLNNLQLFRLEAEGLLSDESLELFDSLVQQTAADLKKLGDLDTVREKQMAGGIGIDWAAQR